MSEPQSTRTKIEAAVGRFLFSLPAGLQRLIAGGGTVRLDNQELAPDVQMMIRLLALQGHKPVDTMHPTAARLEMRRAAATMIGAHAELARYDTLTVPGATGDMPARLYRPARPSGPVNELVVYYHGGGWVVGDLITHEPTCRFLAHHAGAKILAIEYRLAPEHPFPAAVDDALAAFRWAVENATRFGVDPTRIAVAGDSAGGNLSAVVAQLAAAAGPVPKAQLLIYPATDFTEKRRSYRLFTDGFFLTEGEMDWYRDHYLPNQADHRDPRASPLLAEDLTGLPPAVVLTAGFDVLRDEGEEYARRLEAAGVPTRLHRYPGLIHGFANATVVSPSSRRAMEEGATDLRELLAS